MTLAHSPLEETLTLVEVKVLLTVTAAWLISDMAGRKMCVPVRAVWITTVVSVNENEGCDEEMRDRVAEVNPRHGIYALVVGYHYILR